MAFFKSYRSFVNRNTLLSRGIVTDGYICEIQEEEEIDTETGNTIINKIPFMAYIDNKGMKHKYRISTTTDLAKYHLDDKYKIVYDPT